MRYSNNNFSINTNLADKCFENLLDKTWKIGMIDDNKDLLNENNDMFYKTVTYPGFNDNQVRVFKNKVNVRLYDNTEVKAHIIHWVKSSGWFCVTFNSFWDQFDGED